MGKLVAALALLIALPLFLGNTIGQVYAPIRSRPVMQAPIRSRPVMLSVELFLEVAGSVNVLFMLPMLSVFFLPNCMTKVKWQPSVAQDSKQGLVARRIFLDFGEIFI